MYLEEVDSPRAKLVLLYLHERDPHTPRQLADELDTSLLSTLGLLDTLCRNRLVERHDGHVMLQPEYPESTSN